MAQGFRLSSWRGTVGDKGGKKAKPTPTLSSTTLTYQDSSLSVGSCFLEAVVLFQLENTAKLQLLLFSCALVKHVFWGVVSHQSLSSSTAAFLLNGKPDIKREASCVF